MLDQLQNMFENMKSAEKRGPSPAEREMRRQMGELDKLMRDQQACATKRFAATSARRSAGAAPHGGRQQPDEDGQPQEQRQFLRKDEERQAISAARRAPEARCAIGSRELQQRHEGAGAQGRKGIRRRRRRDGRGRGRPEGRAAQRARADARRRRRAARSRPCARARRACRSRCRARAARGGVEATTRPGRAAETAAIPWAAIANGIKGGATDGRLTERSAPPSAPIACWRNCAAASPIPIAPARSAIISNAC